MKYPYTNTHELNLDWIISIIKDFQANYSGINDALDAAISAITASGEATSEEIRALGIEVGNTITQLQSQAETAITNKQGQSIAAIEAETTAAENRITNLLNSIPATYEDALGQLQIINSILNGTEPNLLTWAQGVYRANQQATGYELVSSQHYATSFMQAGCALRKARIKSKNSQQRIYQITWWDPFLNLMHIETTGWVDEIEYTFPAESGFFSVSLTASPVPTDSTINVNDVRVDIEWFSALSEIGHLKSSPNLFPGSWWPVAGYLDANGNLIQDGTFCTTNPIRLKAGSYLFNIRMASYGTFGKNVYVCDSSGAVLRIVPGVDTGVVWSSDRNIIKFTLDTECYIRTNVGKSPAFADTFMIVPGVDAVDFPNTYVPYAEPVFVLNDSIGLSSAMIEQVREIVESMINASTP